MSPRGAQCAPRIGASAIARCRARHGSRQGRRHVVAETTERPKKLKEVFAEKGLITHSQMKKRVPIKDRKDADGNIVDPKGWEKVEFPWGDGIVRGYKPKASK